MTPIALLLLAACDRPSDDAAQQPGVATTIMNQAPPAIRPTDAPANAIVPVEPAPRIDTPPSPAASDGLIPAAFQGRWTGAADRCGDRAAALELTIAPDQMIFHESVGAVQAVREGTDGRVTIDAAFTGEGQSWTRTLALRISADGRALTIVNDGTAVTRKRC
ncbi:hypothetical protein Q4610_15730 [Sphingobium sp. HBC34]|uniref:Lipoprotein n=1 Tax=Sphingobium cyanobacteriorum TaxID=3063954 RepID=A0ABT8ZQL3_9SPHN|nr:hypothetical protein [Sphingobium sp. HBC34]MDO7836497.1 hypothetical protein [Sphingobium sp. HBC34]